MVEMFEWLLDKLPPIDLPAGFEEELSQLISFGMILDRIIPIHEALGLLALYILILVCLTLYRFVKSWIPFV
ncbi:MAG: hypothetical protein LBN39_06780 [Planctomycetaceae bacterium]|nr:hypothetical protein [Planctomycetaceae bacterium]